MLMRRQESVSPRTSSRDYILGARPRSFGVRDGRVRHIDLALLTLAIDVYDVYDM